MASVAHSAERLTILSKEKPRETPKPPPETVVDGSVAGELVDDADDTLSELFGALGDARRVTVCLKRAEGASWKQCAAAAGVTDDTIILWRRRWPMDELITQLTMRTARAGVVRIAARMEGAADAVCDHLDGTLKYDIDTERLRSTAAKTTLGLVLKLLEVAPAQGTSSAKQKANGEISTAELIRRAREIRSLGRGNKT